MLAWFILLTRLSRRRLIRIVAIGAEAAKSVKQGIRRFQEGAGSFSWRSLQEPIPSGRQLGNIAGSVSVPEE